MNLKNQIKIIFIFTSLSLFNSVSYSENIQFNPEAPIYIEYKSKDIKTKDDVSVQIEDALGKAKIRLALQAKPEATSVYYGYIWLQLGKKPTNEVLVRKTKSETLQGWVSEQDGLQALFLFDDAKELADFKKKALDSKKALVDKTKLPQLVNPTPQAPTAVKAIENVNPELGEALKYAKLMSAYNEFTPEQRKLNDERAQQLADSALKQYQLHNYAMAENQFTESLKLNPTVGMNKYYLALCYYQSKKYERSLALLSLAEGADYNNAEYKYYTGLNAMKVKNYTKALDSFADAKDEKDADYSGPAAFFSGHILFQKEEYTQARPEFEFTIDQSKNPKMDRESEAMIEKIDMIEGYKNQMKERFKYSLFMGLGYDSNVLNISTENLSTNLAAYRLLYGATANYKFFYDFTHDLSVDLGLSDYYSMNDKFKSDSTVQSADPLSMSVGLPYHRRFQAGQRIYTWGLTPSYQTLNMSLEDSTRKKILDSTVVATDLNFAVSENYYSRINLEYSMDKSSIVATTDANDLSASKITLSTTQTLVPQSTDKKNYMIDLAYINNNAKGDNNDYTKLNGGLTYSQLGLWKATNSVKLDYTNTKYPNTADTRTDSIINLTLGLIKDLSKQLSLNINGQYTISSSTIDTYKYNKFLIQSVLTYSGAF